MLYEEDTKMIANRLLPVFEEREYENATKKADEAAGVLILAARWGAGDALAGSILRGFNRGGISTLWRWLSNEKPEPEGLPRAASILFSIFECKTGDERIDSILKDLRSYSLSGGRWPE